MRTISIPDGDHPHRPSVGNFRSRTLCQMAFGALRYLSGWFENTEFVLHRDPYRQAKSLVTSRISVCRSSREGRCGRCEDRGIRAIIGSGFGDIFLPVFSERNPSHRRRSIDRRLSAAEFENTQGAGRYSVDLEAQTITSPSERHIFEIDPRRAPMLKASMKCLADVGSRRQILAFQASDRAARRGIHFAMTSAECLSNMDR